MLISFLFINLLRTLKKNILFIKKLILLSIWSSDVILYEHIAS